MNDASVKNTPALAARGPVKLTAGQVMGAVSPESENVSRFLGIPFAAPPMGDLRWRPPQAIDPWDGVRSAESFGPAPTQPIDPMLSLFGLQDGDEMSEDCLHLNVWTPASDANESRPVMVWIHGGGFRIGHAAHRMYNGVRLAERGVVVVTINYRLNVAGGFAHPLLSEESGNDASGNYALLDQIAALQWVRDNISAFGGNPKNVTIFGESAGGRSVSVLMTSPLAKDLFHKGICQSGALRDTGGTLAAREVQGVTIAKAIGCSTLPELRTADWRAMEDPFPFDSNPFVDGWVVPDTPEALYANGKIHNKPLLIGTNANEAGLFAQMLSTPIDTTAKFRAVVEEEFGPATTEILAAYPAASNVDAQGAWNALRTDMWFSLPARKQSRWLEAAGRQSYLYCLSRIPPWRGGKTMGAHHGAEIAYVFGGGVRCGSFDPDGAQDPLDRALSDAIMCYWVNFAATGDPNGDGLPDWTAYSSSNQDYLHFANTAAADTNLFRERLDVLEAALVHHSGKSNIYGD
jgi:para-nitrobenzyl esterase